MTGEPPHPDASGTGLPGDLFIAEGDKVVRQLISSPHTVLSALVAEHTLDHHLPFLEGLDPDTPVFVVPRGAVERIAGFDMHRGLLACGRRTDPGPAPELARKSGLVVVLEDLRNHDNVGGVFRAARALAPPRAAKPHPVCVLLSPRCCDPLYRKALRVSMGNALHVPFATLEPWPAALASLAPPAFDLLAMTPAPDAADIREIRSGPERVPVLILGTEGPGLSSNTVEAVRALGGRTVRIDIEPDADSLNVAVACAVAMHRLRG